MVIGFVTSNPSFSQPLVDEFNRRGHETACYQPTSSDASNWYQLGQLHARADRIFVDWAQPPLLEVLQHFEPDRRPVFCRAHRIEMYADEYIQKVPWSKLEALFFIAPHVRDRMMEKIDNPPKRVACLPHVGINTDQWWIDAAARSWEPPFRVIMAGNLVPKKRVYTACQLVHDLGPDWQFWYYGSGGTLGGYGNDEYHVNVSDLIDRLDMGERFYGSGHIPQAELREQYQAAHFVLSASNEEGCHTSIAEGMACGCVPLVNCWRGAESIYPAEWVWESPKALYRLVEQWQAMPVEERIALAQSMRERVVPAYDERVIAGQVADIVCGPLDAASVGEWYSTEMFEHMVEQDGNERQREALAAVQRLLPDDRPARLLEVACGTGYIAREAAAAGNVTAFAQDVARKLIEWANDHNPHGATIVYGDATEGVVRGPHDVVTLIDCLEHIPAQHHKDLLTRVAGELAPGGYVICRFPWMEQDRQIIEEPVFPKVVRRMLTDLGLKITQYRPVEPYFEVVAQR
jgi:glycosyltransferase involved in cell wall biosynthesis/SAM-dependent methyltransferase